MPRVKNTRPTLIYLLVDIRPETLIDHPNGLPFYCGKTVKDPTARLSGHRADARRNVNRPLCKHLISCGSYVRIDVIEVVSASDNWQERERFWIATLRYFSSGCVNVQRGGEGTPGLIHSKESRAKMSRARKGVSRGPFSEEHRLRISLAKIGRPLGPCGEEHRAKLSAALKGRTVTEEWRAKLSAAAKGRKHSAEHRAKAGNASRGRKQSEQTIAKRIATMTSIRATPEYRAKMSAAGRIPKRRILPCPVPLPR